MSTMAGLYVMTTFRIVVWIAHVLLLKMECLANYAGRVEAILLMNLLVLPQLLVKMKHKKCAQLFSIVLATK